MASAAECSSSSSSSISGGCEEFITFSVREVGVSPMFFKLRRSQRLGVMFREYARRRELSLNRATAFKFYVDGEAIDSEHTARMIHLRERDVVEAVEGESALCRGDYLERFRSAMAAAEDRDEVMAAAEALDAESEDRPTAALGTTFSRFARGVGPAGCVVLARNCDEDSAREALRAYGSVESCARDGDDAVVRFGSAEAANRAVVNANGLVVGGRRIAVSHLVSCLPPSPEICRPSSAAVSAAPESEEEDDEDEEDEDEEEEEEDDDDEEEDRQQHHQQQKLEEWVPQSRPTTVVCRWTIEVKKSEIARSHKGEYHEVAFADAAGNKWLLYYFLDGDGADNAGHVSLYLSVRDAARLPFGWSKNATFSMTLEHENPSRHYSKWATQAFRAAPPPAVQDWGWPKFASHAELHSRGLLDGSKRLRVRAAVTVSSSSCDISEADADACLLSAARVGAADAVKRCLRAGADARTCRDLAAGSARTPLHLACARGHRADADAAAAAIVSVLAAAGADVDAEDAHGETALHLAVAKGAARAALALLEAGADPARPVRGASPREDALTLAAGAGRAELAASLLAAGAPPTSEAVLLAAKKGHLDVLWPVLDAAKEDECLPEIVAARNAKGDTAVALLVARGLVDAAAKMVTAYRAPVADCSRDRKAARHARLRILLKQREHARNNNNRHHHKEFPGHDDDDLEEEEEEDEDDEGGATNNNNNNVVAKQQQRRGQEPLEEKRRKLVEELEAEEAEKEAKNAKQREKKRAKRQKQRKRKAEHKAEKKPPPPPEVVFSASSSSETSTEDEGEEEKTTTDGATPEPALNSIDPPPPPPLPPPPPPPPPSAVARSAKSETCLEEAGANEIARRLSCLLGSRVDLQLTRSLSVDIDETPKAWDTPFGAFL
ncbi:hypothetical protein CTAYLR_006922 [Chrysophaeum taylorii]|uniref:MATH domain-containing protein n=1 Tax=Chrysophaeum taylorii TaxID=2483200 RepID=A0AAD7UAY4_9STRA|nr:hypothetical protein CTAYLR_006922 [Chrysophaeum taylorii]